MADQGFFSLVVGYADPVHHVLLAAGLASLRLYAAFAILPAMGDRFLRGFVRQGVIAMLALYIGAGVPASSFEQLGTAELVFHAAKESAIGLLIGYVGAQVFWVAESVGALIDLQSGFNNVQLTNPMSGQQSTPVSDLLLHLVVVVFFGLGGMLVFLGALFDSFHVWPMLAPLPDIGRAADLFVIGQTESLMIGIVRFASPVLLLLVLVDLGFGHGPVAMESPSFRA